VIPDGESSLPETFQIRVLTLGILPVVVIDDPRILLCTDDLSFGRSRQCFTFAEILSCTITRETLSEFTREEGIKK
jgi:hypothetical protein